MFGGVEKTGKLFHGPAYKLLWSTHLTSARWMSKLFREKQIKRPIMTPRSYLIVTTLVLTFLLAGATAGPAQSLSELLLDPLGGQPVTLEGFASLDGVSPGGTVNIAVGLKMSGHWHVNANTVNDEYLIPTTVDITAPAGITVQRIVYPEGIEKELDFSETPMRLYEGEAFIGATLDVARDLEPGERKVTVTVNYQACDNEKCLAPVSENVVIPLIVTSPTDLIDATHTDVFSKIDFGAATLGAGATSAAGSGRLLGR